MPQSCFLHFFYSALPPVLFIRKATMENILDGIKPQINTIPGKASHLKATPISHTIPIQENMEKLKESIKDNSRKAVKLKLKRKYDEKRNRFMD